MYSVTICKLAPTGVLFDNVRVEVSEPAQIATHVQVNYPGWKVNGYCLTTLKAALVS